MDWVQIFYVIQCIPSCATFFPLNTNLLSFFCVHSYFVTVDVCMNASCCSICISSFLIILIESIILNRFPDCSTFANKLSAVRLADKDVV